MSTDSGPAEQSLPGQSLMQPMAVLRRRRTPVLIVLAMAVVTCVLIATLWPATYVSTGTILIEQQEVPTDLVRSTISSYADQRIQVISQRVMTTSNLLQIIQQYDLYPQERKKKGRESIIQMMRSDVKFRTISADVIDPRQGRPVQATIAFSLGFQSKSPELAAKVANELSSLYLQENLTTRRQLTEQATKFLSEEADKLSRQINDVENRLATFKQQNLNNLPEVAQLNIQLVSRGDDERREIDSQLHTLEQQMLYLDAQLAQISPASQIYTSTGERVMSQPDRLKILRSDYERASAVYAENHPDVVRLKRMVEALESSTEASASDNDRVRQLRDAESRLAQIRQRYAPEHPDVIKLERLVTSLQVEPVPGRTGTASAAASAAADNPVYIQLRTQREALSNEHKSLQAKRVALGTRVAELERRLESSPGVERDYTAMRRDLDNTQTKYREVRQKQMEAQLAQSLELERKGERFSLIEPPLVPEDPASPNRQMIIVLGLVMALVAAGGTAVLLEFLDGSVRGAGDIASLLTAAPLAVIPYFQQPTQLDRRRRRFWVLLIAAVACAVAFLTLVHLLYRPLDVLWAVLSRRLGG